MYDESGDLNGVWRTVSDTLADLFIGNGTCGQLLQGLRREMLDRS